MDKKNEGTTEEQQRRRYAGGQRQRPGRPPDSAAPPEQRRERPAAQSGREQAEEHREDAAHTVPATPVRGERTDEGSRGTEDVPGATTTPRRQPGVARNRIVARTVQVVDYLFYLLYALLGIRFVLGLLGAREDAGFVQLIHTLTDPFYEPFTGIVARPAANGGVVDLPLIVALIGYFVLHLAVRGLLRLFMSRDHVTITRTP